MNGDCADGPEAGRARASREALDWMVLLNDDPGDEHQRRGFEAWLAADPAHREAWQHHASTYALLGSASGDLRGQWEHADRLPSDAGARRMPMSHRGRWIAAAAAACLAVFAAPTVWLHLAADRVTQTAEIGRQVLPDGSHVLLAPESAIAVHYTAEGRDIRLLKGQAFFDVVKDRQRPFRVAAGDARTTVLGTAFDVRLRAEGVRVAVMRGRVRVARRDGSDPQAALLERGEWAYLHDSGVQETGVQPSSAAPGWIDRRLTIDDRTIAEAIDEIRPWYGGRIIFANEALGNRRVTSTLDLSDPAEAVRSLVGVYGGSVHRVTPWLIVIT